MLQDQVVCDNDGQLGDDLDEVHTVHTDMQAAFLMCDTPFYILQDSFFQDIDTLQSHGIVSGKKLQSRS